MVPAAFPDPAQFPACRFLEQHLEVFAAELESIPEDEWAPWCELDRRDRCPRSRALLRRISGLEVAAFSWLGPGCHVFAHRDGHACPAVRVHLPLRTNPGALLRVAGETRRWELGRCLCFDLDQVHEAFNGGHEPRVALLLEIAQAHASEEVLRADA